ncbi:MAG: hypothetical protein GY725_13585, partial [bacterium]|nr:hypothetical protein [bacterium]
MSYRYLWLSVCFTVCSVLLMSSAARAQVDIESMRSIVAQCPDVGSATIGGLPATFMCADINGTPLDDPIRPGAGSLDRIHAGSFSLELRQQLLTAARPYIGETRFEELQTRIGNGQIISQAAEHERRASLSEAAWLEAAGNAAGAAALRARGAALLHVDPTDLSSPFLFEAAITGADGGVALLDTRADIPRLPDLQSGLLTSQSVADTVSEYAPGLTQDMNQDVLIGVPAGLDQRKVRRNAIPFFLGPDGLANTADDLPFETGGLIRATPFAGTNDPYNPSTAGLPGRPRFIASGQVADRNGVSRELYGVFEPNHLSFRGCALNSQLLGGTLFTYNSATHTCTDNATGASIPDVYTVFDPAVYGALTPDQKALADKVFTLGCSEQADRAYNFTDTRMAGLNADGDCIRMNSDGVNSSTDRIHFDVLPLLGDTRFRPAGASLEPTNLTDLVTGPGAPIARPKSPTGTILFPNTPPFERL